MRLPQWLDVASPVHEFRRGALQLLVKISNRSGRLPESLFIRGLVVEDVPLVHGGFADVFRGSYLGVPVAVKRLRVLEDDKSARQVSSSPYHSLSLCDLSIYPIETLSGDPRLAAYEASIYPPVLRL
jgi:hypothetical protein